MLEFGSVPKVAVNQVTTTTYIRSIIEVYIALNMGLHDTYHLSNRKVDLKSHF